MGQNCEQIAEKKQVERSVERLAADRERIGERMSQKPDLT